MSGVFSVDVSSGRERFALLSQVGFSRRLRSHRPSGPPASVPAAPSSARVATEGSRLRVALFLLSLFYFSAIKARVYKERAAARTLYFLMHSTHRRELLSKKINM